ncbi:hypothetical protein SAMN04489740_2853 [Arthrobacter alpinus]|uniref:Uncharacterized protein n=2 Tax=Arthrobacter alpinus TaxID=656366 RepID=A0A1H5MB35_9MICC|nr:hypothetical protein SAMN04489740_2853 [Arthrobacter alpinus]
MKTASARRPFECPYPDLMEIVLLDQVVKTDYGQLDVIWILDGGFDGDSDRYFAGQVNGLVGASASSGVYINLARRSGGSHVRMVLREAPPANDDARWEDVVEVSFAIPTGHEVRWCSWAGESWGALKAIIPGSYRMRVSASGRDEGRDGEFFHGVVDTYLVQLWPDNLKPDAILRATSEDGQYWHREFGSRR